MSPAFSAFSRTGLPCFPRWIIGCTLGALASALPARASVTVPTVANKQADQLATTSARLRGTIVSTGGNAPAATIYWGTVDGEMNAAAWQHSASQGFQANDFSEAVTGLSPATTYYYRSAATNSAGTAWAGAAASFTTPPLSGPVIENRDATGLTATTASVRAEVVNDGGSSVTVTFYWGPLDGGTDAAAWASTAPAGPTVGTVSRFLGGLTPNTVNFFRARATNATGTSWAPASATFTTRRAGPDRIVINEVLYQRPNSDPTKVGQASEFLPATKAIEFVELHNPTAAAVDLGGWRLADGVDYLFPAGTMLADGGYLCVGQNPAHFQTQFGFLPLGPWIGELSRQKGRIRLQNATGLTVDEVNYEAGFPWPTQAKGGGESLELINPLLDHDLGASWRSSGAGSTLVPVTSANWRWRKGTSEASDPVEAWRAKDFAEDASWSTGAAPFGYGVTGVTFGTPLTDMMQNDGAGVPGYSSLFLRHPFSLAEGQVISQLTLRMFIDDGCLVWLNGTQVASSLPPATPTYDALAAGSNSSNGGTAVTVNLANAAELLQPGQNLLAVQAFNALKANNDFRFALELSAFVPTGAVRSPSPGLRNTVASTLAPPAIRQVVHSPPQPPAATDVVVSAKVTDPEGIGSVTLRYQKVDPGAYIPRVTINASRVASANPAYENPANWTSIAMHDDGLAGDAVAGDSVFSAIIPSTEQIHRRLVRYRVVATDTASTPSTTTVPYGDDEQPNFAYFCYDGIPEWKGAFRPVADAAGALTPPQTFPTTVTRSLQAYHVIAATADVQNSQYTTSYDEVRFYGTMVSDGIVYDHIQFSNRGEFSTYNTGKNKWRFRFNRARGFAVKDNLGRPDDQLRNGFSLEACAAPWATVNRGMAGLDSAVPYKIYSLCGHPSPATRYFQLRVIDSVNESHPTNQYDTDLWGLYLGVEDYDSDFLQARGLPEGNIYKLSSGNPDQKSQAETLPTNRTDWTSFNSQSTANPLPNATFWKTRMDVDAYYTFHALNRFVGNVDLRGGANHHFYHRASDDRWLALPWDLDMMFIAKNHWYTNYDGKSVPGVIVQHRLYDVPALKIELKNRARELLDLMGENGSPQGGQIGQLIDEFAQIVNPTGEALTWADIDAALWNQNPKSTGSAASASGQNNAKGNFYRAPWGDMRGVGGAGGNWRRWLKTPTFTGTADFEDFVKFLTDYTTNTYPATDPAWAINNAGLPNLTTNPDVQLGYGYKYLEFEANDTGVPTRPAISYSGGEGYPANDLRFESSAFTPNATGGSTFAAMEWRLGEVSAPGIPFYDPGEERIYEVQSLWSSGELPVFASSVQVPASVVRTGHTYRARVRHKDANGRWSRWSLAAQFISGEANVAVFRENLMITEINYHPYAPNAAEAAAGHSAENFEFIELRNIGATPLDLTSVRFTKGIDADIPAGTTLAPGAFGLIVKNLEAFRLRYGTGHDSQILATMGDTNLSNSGETVKLSFGQGEPIHEFAYADVSPWPTSPDGQGPSLVLVSPAARPDHALAGNWRASVPPGGSPGSDETTGMTYSLWAAAYPGAENPSGDTDGDSLINKFEYAFGGNPLVPGPSPSPVAGLQSLEGAGQLDTFLTVSFTHPDGLSDVSYLVEFSDTLAAWSVNGVLVSKTVNGNGTITEVWRSPQPASAQADWFVRVKVP